MTRKTELLLHAAIAATALAALLAGSQSSPPVSDSPSPGGSQSANERSQPESATPSDAVRTQLRELQWTKIKNLDLIKDPARRRDAYLRQADEAFRSSPALALRIIEMADSSLAGYEGYTSGQGLLSLFSSEWTSTEFENKRLRALCGGEALLQLTSSEKYRKTQAQERTGAWRDFWQTNPDSAIEYIEAHPFAAADGAGVWLPENPDLRSRVAKLIFTNSPENTELLRSQSISDPLLLNKESRSLAGTALARHGDPDSEWNRYTILGFYAKADPETKKTMLAEASAAVKTLLQAEQSIEEGSFSADDWGSFALQIPAREQPLSDSLLRDGLEKMIATSKISDDQLKTLFQQVEDPVLLLAGSSLGAHKESAKALYTAWATNDPVGLSRALSGQSLPAADQAVVALLASQTHDPEAQLQWGLRIADPQLRNEVLEPLLHKYSATLPQLVQEIRQKAGQP